MLLFGLMHVVVGDIVPARSISSHMVLSDAGAILWGNLTAPDVVGPISVRTSVAGLNGTGSSFMGADGVAKWRVEFPSLSSLPHSSVNITISTSHSSLTLSDVLFGDVWLCSGQSNMQFSLISAMNGSAEIAASGNYSDIRVLNLERVMAVEPMEDLAEDGLYFPWARASPSTVGGEPWTYMSAVCWLYGRTLYDRLSAAGQRRPLGLIASSWGGTIVEAWTPPDQLEACGAKQTPRALCTDLSKPNDCTSSLYNAMIHPFLNTTLKGAIWYQGEQNVVPTTYGGGPSNYSRCFPSMISGWRKAFSGQSSSSQSFPFGYVELSGWCESADGGDCGAAVNDKHYIAQLRLSQAATHFAVPNEDEENVFRAIAYDLEFPNGTYGDIHPTPKTPVGDRLSRAAMVVAYGHDVSAEYRQSPTITSCQASTATIEVTFSYPLTWNKAAPRSNFDVRGADNVWRNTSIVSVSGSKVTLLVPGGGSPTGVRYAWTSNPCCPPWIYPRCAPIMNCAVYDTGSGDQKLPIATFTADIQGRKCVPPQHPYPHQQ